MNTPIDTTKLAAIIIKQHEGFEQFPYKCSAGRLTIGFGRNIQDVGISKREGGFLLSCDIEDRLDYLETFLFFKSLSPARQAALIDMCYQLGKKGFSQFKNMIAALNNADYETVAKEMLDSKWAKFDTPERAANIAHMIRKG